MCIIYKGPNISGPYTFRVTTKVYLVDPEIFISSNQMHCGLFLVNEVLSITFEAIKFHSEKNNSPHPLLEVEGGRCHQQVNLITCKALQKVSP